MQILMSSIIIHLFKGSMNCSMLLVANVDFPLLVRPRSLTRSLALRLSDMLWSTGGDSFWSVTNGKVLHDPISWGPAGFDNRRGLLGGSRYSTTRSTKLRFNSSPVSDGGSSTPMTTEQPGQCDTHTGGTSRNVIGKEAQCSREEPRAAQSIEV